MWLALTSHTGSSGFLPGCLGQTPDRAGNGHVHVTGKDGKAVITVVRAGVIPAVHLAERHAHLLEHVLFLDAGADQIRFDLVNEVLKLVAGHVVINQRGVLDVVRGALVVVVVTKLVARADHDHAQIFVGANHVAGAQATDVQHDGFAFQTRLELVHHGLHQRLVLGNHFFGLGLDALVKVAGNFAQALLDHGRAEEVVLHPWNTVLLFHVPADVVHRAVAVQHIELGFGCVLDLGDGAVTRPLRNHTQPHFFKQNAAGPGITTDVVVTNDGHVVGGGDECGVLVGLDLVEHPVADRVVGQVVAKRLAHATETFAAHGHDGLSSVFLALLFRHSFDVVANQADRALRLNRDAFVQGKEFLNLVNDLVKLLVTAKNDVFFLEVGGELHRHKGVDASGADVIVTPGSPRILAAADRAVADVDHVFDRAPHHAFGASVGATANRHH